ncbi:hypothetical protein A8H39_00085 [Paraburkholderia fungorum]|uniref:hypothetical protein n=1 Tax=Paraburkholderia fungorum TaxID=134537 RepID=UPI0004849B4F|nr:hypothetical protein [Paraburkholderia fungorum]PNE59584.1 hypothetical protein A8H39_00085 [Paraburkholderia fungorum]
MNLVEVTQEGAGILDIANSVADGFFTAGVETCCVYIFYGAQRYALVHDTGQIALPAIVAIARQCGTIQEAFCAINPLRVSREADELHEDRRGRLKNLLKLKRGMSKLVIPDGNLACLSNRTSLVTNQQIMAYDPAFTRAPGADVRKQINILNNLFSKKNSQSLPVDFQFDVDHYTAYPPLLKTDAEMQALAEDKLRQGDTDYLGMLKAAREIFASASAVERI